MGPANAIPAVVDAPPGFMSHNELGLMPLRGVIRPERSPSASGSG
jgi:hypothetical protein